MKILYLMNGLAVCGGVRVVWHHCLELNKLGHHAVYGVIGGRPKMEWLPGDVPIMKLNATKEESWDVVVATGYESWPVVKGFSNAGIKAGFVQMKESLFFKDKDAGAAAHKAFEIKLGPVITISGWLREWLMELGHKTVEIVPNGVDTSLFYPDPWPKVGDRPIALIVGHELSPAKNVRDAAKAAKEAGCEIWHVCSTKEAAISSDRLWIDPTQETLRHIYSTADILVMSSRYEGRSCIPVEAMACKTPVVALDHKGTEDLMLGRAIICPTPDLLVGGIRMVLYDKEGTALMIDRAYRYVNEKLTWPGVGARLEKLYGAWSRV